MILALCTNSYPPDPNRSFSSPSPIPLLTPALFCRRLCICAQSTMYSTRSSYPTPLSFTMEILRSAERPFLQAWLAPVLSAMSHGPLRRSIGFRPLLQLQKYLCPVALTSYVARRYSRLGKSTSMNSLVSRLPSSPRMASTGLSCPLRDGCRFPNVLGQIQKPERCRPKWYRPRSCRA